MKEYQYSIIRRESRNPKRNREGRGISQSDLEALKQELDGNSQGLVSAIYDRDIALDSLAVTSGDISERLKAAEEALTGKLDSGDFSKWKAGDLANLLAGKQPVGSYVDPSQLATSQQQAVDEAVKRAGEMDKQLKVGGRNLLIGERFSKETTPSREIWIGNITSIIDNNNLIGETVTWSFDLKCDKAHTFSAYQLGTIWFTSYTNATVEAGEWKRVSFTGVVRDTDNPTGSTDRNCILVVYGDYDSGYFPITRHHKLERGTIPTDWTPAPEDVAESVSKVSKSLEELSDHPLTVDKDGYWKIWSVKDGAYKTTQYQSRGEAGHNPAPEDVLKTESFKTLLGGEVTSQVKPLEDELDSTSNKTDEALRRATHSLNNLQTLGGKINTANNNIASLSKRSLTLQQKEDLGYLTSVLRLKMAGGEGDKKTLEGLTLQRYIALSGDNKTVTAYLASDALDAVLKAGIVDFGKPTEREQVEITHQGTGHFGNLYFAGNQIDFRTDEHTDPYLSIGAEESQFIDNFLRTARLDDTPVSVSSVTLTTSTTSDERTVDVANDGTRLTINIDDINVATYNGAKTRLTLDGEVLAEWQGRRKIVRGLDNVEVYEEPYTASDLSYERVVKAGRHAIRLEIVQPTDGATATIRGLRVRRRYDTGAQQSALTKSGLRLFGSPDRYLDVDYRKEYYNGPNNDGYIVGWIDNDYTVRIKGGAKVDKLTADELDVPGVPLCGATFDEGGGQINSFGAKAKQQGYTYAQAYRAYNADFYRVYHSIGHKNYIPVLQVYGLSNGNYSQCLTTRIDAIEANSFAVRIVTSGNLSIKHSFSYVAFKTTE